MTIFRLRRALLFMPGDNMHKIEKGAGLGIDGMIMDLEDGVALSKKAVARTTTLYALQTLQFGTTERLIRINPVGSPFWRDDLAGTIEGHPDCYIIPKVESAEQVKRVAIWLREAEHQRGWEKTPLIAIIETALGIVHLTEIAMANRRLVALAFGAEDFAGSIGATRTPAGKEVLYARSAVVTHAAAFGLSAIDTPFVNLNDDDGLIRDTTSGMQMGYTGKLAIHPKQITPITQTFNPTESAIAYARRVLEANTAQQEGGTGVFELDGQMIDMPMVHAAETVMARAKAANLI